MDKILNLLNEIEEKEMPKEFERTLSLALKQETKAMKRKKMTKMVSVMAASFLVVFGSISVYNDFGGIRSGGGADGALVVMMAEDSMVEENASDLVRKMNYGRLDSDYHALLDEYFEGKDYFLEEFYQEENGDLIFHIVFEGEKLVLIEKLGEIYEQDREEQDLNSD